MGWTIFIHTQTSIVHLLKFGYGKVISSHILLWMWLHIHIHAGIKLNHVSKRGPKWSVNCIVTFHKSSNWSLTFFAQIQHQNSQLLESWNHLWKWSQYANVRIHAKTFKQNEVKAKWSPFCRQNFSNLFSCTKIIVICFKPKTPN